MSVYEKLMNVQAELKAPKAQKNNFGNYNYRSAEDILEAVKPLLSANKLAITISDAITAVNDRVYVKATVKVNCIETKEYVEVSASAREAEMKKGMDSSQVTGATSSYARKYALNGMFAIDDTKDADSMDNRQSGTAKKLFKTKAERNEYITGIVNAIQTNEPTEIAELWRELTSEQQQDLWREFGSQQQATIRGALV